MAQDRPATPEEIRRIPSLANLADEELDTLLEATETLAFDDGASLFEEGDPADALYFVVQGSVRIHKSAAGGGRMEIAVLPAGSIFGELGLLLRRKRTGAVSALGEVRVLRMPRTALIEHYRCGERYALALLLGVAITLAQRLETSNLRVSANRQRARGSDLESFKRTILEEWAL